MPDKTPQMPLFESSAEYKTDGPVTCLGMTFANDAERRAHFTELLRQKLQDPEFRQIEGFPIGEDEDILALSDPPYYTTCPNPWLGDFVAEWEAQKPEKPADYRYHREPFAADVSEGKNDPIYNAHSYHTKVPHKAIMRYILHYTEPGDIVFDGFCGTGMTGVAAQMCGDTNEIESLDFTIRNEDGVFDKNGNQISNFGQRHTIICDLSPLATFISFNLNYPMLQEEFLNTYTQLLEKFEGLQNRFYSSFDEVGTKNGLINYVIWSDVYVCSECSEEYDYWHAAVDLKGGIAKKVFNCPNCGAKQSTRNLDRAYQTEVDILSGNPTRLFKQVPVQVSYLPSDTRKLQRLWNTYDENFLKNLELKSVSRGGFPIVPLTKGDRWKRDAFEDKGITHVHHFYTSRTLEVLATILEGIKGAEFDYRSRIAMLFLFTSFADRNATKRNRFVINNHNPRGRVNGPMANSLYLPNLFCEMNIFRLMDSKFGDILKSFPQRALQTSRSTAISTGSSSDMLRIPSNSVDYIFTDPPFGHNIQYSELNASLESFLRIKTANDEDTVVNETVGKPMYAYTHMLLKIFKEYYRILKCGKWLTVEFHNSQAAVWTAIQEAVGGAGFVIAHVATLDKKQKTVHQDTNISGTVNQDLIISAYKPNDGLEERFKLIAGSEDGVWDFIRTHLKQLPIFIPKNGNSEPIVERQNYLLFDRMVAFHVRRGVTIPISAPEFYNGLAQRFPERDSMYFLPEQVADYDRKRLTVKEFQQLNFIVIDELSAIHWLRQQLQKKPQTFQDIHPQFTQQLTGWRKSETQLDLRDLLQQNFLSYNGKGPVPEQIHAYLSSNWKDMRNLPKDDPALVAKAKDRWYVPDPNKQADLDKLRERSLLREFETYKESSQRKLKLFRIEAVRAGFKQAWQSAPPDYNTIITIARKLPTDVLQEDPKLLMWYDAALTRTGQME